MYARQQERRCLKVKLNKANKDILVDDLKTVISCLKMKRGFLNKDTIPKPLTKETLFDEDIEYLEKEILPKIKELTV